MVTAYWLNDVLNSKKIFSPKIALHIPVPFREKVLRCRNMVSSCAYFDSLSLRFLGLVVYEDGLDSIKKKFYYPWYEAASLNFIIII